MNKNVKGVSFSAALGVASVWFGSHFGPGSSTGQQALSYFTQYGRIGVLLPILTMVVWSICMYYAIEYSRAKNLHNYREFAKSLYHPLGFLAIFMEISFAFATVMACGACLSGAATIIEAQFQVPYYLTVVVMAVISLCLAIFGAEVVRRSSTWLTYGIIIVLIIMTVVALTNDKSMLGEMWRTGGTEQQQNASPWYAIWRSMVYASFQTTLVVNIVSVSDNLKNRKESKLATILGFIINLAMLLALNVVVFAYSPITMGSTLPILSILTEIGMPWLVWLYVVLVVLACVSSILGFLFGNIARYSGMIKLKSEPGRATIIAVVFLAVAIAVTTLGLTGIVNRGFTILGYMNLFAILVPVIFFGVIKVPKLNPDSSISDENK